jgi:hypothetical protein
MLQLKYFILATEVPTRKMFLYSNRHGTLSSIHSKSVKLISIFPTKNVSISRPKWLLTKLFRNEMGHGTIFLGYEQNYAT